MNHLITRRTLIRSGIAGTATGIIRPRSSEAFFARHGGGGTNPFTINENGTQSGGGVVINGNNSIGGKTPRGSNLLTPGEKSLVLLVIGDSISSNSCFSAYTVTNTAKNDNLNHYDGVVYQYADPYLGPSTGPGSYPGAIADALINNGRFARVVTIGCAMGGATSYDWSKFGGFAHRIVASLLYCRRYGYPLSGSGNGGNWSMAVIHALGTNDSALSYSAGAYTALSNSCFSMLRDYGFQGKIFVPEMTVVNNVANPTLQAAQAAIINPSLGILLGMNVDQYTGGTYRQVDGTHPTNALVAQMANSWATILIANL